MNYNDGIEFCKFAYDLSDKFGTHEFYVYYGISLRFPGYKCHGDYRMVLYNSTAPTHWEICKCIYQSVDMNNFEYYINLLEDIYENGLGASCIDEFDEFKNVIYWITLQEEINYPQPRFKGRKMAFMRFIESIYCKIKDNKSMFEDVMYKVISHNHESKKPFDCVLDWEFKPNFYKK